MPRPDEFPFLPVTGYQDPYAAALAEQARQVAEAERAELTPKPMYSAEEARKRKARTQQDLMHGQLGMLANDKSISAIAEPLLKRAMEAQSPQYREHGVYDENSGTFRFFPGYQEARRTDSRRRHQELMENRSASARVSYDQAAMRANEMADLRKYLQQNKPAEERGSLSHSGADANGQPILMHSKLGPVQMDNKGNLTRYTGPITPKLAEMPAGVQTDYLQNRISYASVEAALDMLEKNPEAVGYISYLPNVLSQYVPGKAGKEGVGVRAAISDIGSLKIHDRSGAAVSAKEFPRLKPFIPNVNVDSPNTIRQKLVKFKEVYARTMREIEMGYPLSRLLTNATSTAPIQEQAPPTNAPLSDDDLIQKYMPKKK